jgi:DNA-directed RNA polymerase specialized sigma24 family protein
VEDIAQEVWLSFFCDKRYCALLDRPQHLFDFLRTMARNKTKMVLRQLTARKRDRRRDGPLPTPTSEPERALVDHRFGPAEHAIVTDFWESRPAPYRERAILHFLCSGQDRQEVATRLGISIATLCGVVLRFERWVCTQLA